jgi:amidase
MQATLDRITKLNPSLNAITSLRDAETLLTEARAADVTAPIGPLHGLPIAIKDLANARGLPTTEGFIPFADTIAKTDDIFVSRIRAAGAIIIGKTNTPEFGLGSHTYNPVFGATQNAHSLDRSAGGSSGGAAVALASGMTALADGSDMMGSLRNPAGWNGVYGFRPTWGSIPREPSGDAYLHQLSTTGPMARTPSDIALLLNVMSGPDPRQPHSRPEANIPTTLTPPSPKRIAWLSDWGGAYPTEPGLLDHCETGLTQLSSLGHDIDPIAPPFPATALWEAWTTLRSFSVAMGSLDIYNDPDLRAHLKPEAIWEIERGLSYSALDIQRASELRSDWFRAAIDLFTRYDAAILPTAQCYAFPIHWDWPKDIAGTQMDTYHRWMEVVIPVSLIGLPAIALPIGANSDGHHMGLQLFAKPGEDAALLNLAQHWHITR